MSLSLAKEWYALKESVQNYRDNRYKPLEYYIWKNRYADRLKKFKDIHKGEDCFIIGNGPSLNKMDLTKLNDYYTFGLNKIYYIFDRVGLNLSYYISVNKLVIEQSANEFDKISCPKFLAVEGNSEIEETIANCYPIHTVGGVNGFQENITFPIIEGGTVTAVALQIAYYMGFKQIFLIGVDHNFAVKGTPNEEQTLSGNDESHFDPRYFAGQKWNLPDLEASETSYMLAKYIFNADERKIFDATVDGKLTVYPKISFDQALKISRKASAR